LGSTAIAAATSIASRASFVASCSSVSGFVFGFRVPRSGFRVPGPGFRVSCFVCQASGSGFRISGFGSRVSCSRFRVSCFVFGFRVPGSGSRVPGSGFRVRILSVVFHVSGSEFRADHLARLAARPHHVRWNAPRQRGAETRNPKHETRNPNPKPGIRDEPGTRDPEPGLTIWRDSLPDRTMFGGMLPVAPPHTSQGGGAWGKP